MSLNRIPACSIYVWLLYLPLFLKLDTEVVDLLLVAILQKTEDFSTSRDSFLSHLGAILSSSMKHVVTPSTADGAFHYYEKIVFQIYVITQEVG